jgi:hypothetical protein
MVLRRFENGYENRYEKLRGENVLTTQQRTYFERFFQYVPNEPDTPPL